MTQMDSRLHGNDRGIKYFSLPNLLYSSEYLIYLLIFMAIRRITAATWITISRFFLVPIFIYLFAIKHYQASIIVLITACLTDMLDGFVARKFNQRTRLGSMLDPLADKFLMLLSLLCLTYLGSIPQSFTWLVIGRDVGIVFGAGVLSVILKIRLYYKPTLLSKLATTSQIGVLIISFLEVMVSRGALSEMELNLGLIQNFQDDVLLIAASLTLITAMQYGYMGYKFLRFGERRK